MTMNLTFKHLAVGAAAIVGGAATAFGLIGAGTDTVEQWQTVVRPDGANGVAIRETIDVDFKRNLKHGIIREIPHDFGEPDNVAVRSPSAPDDLNATYQGGYTEFRIGDPDQTTGGQHRYVIDYVLPDADLAGNVLNLDIVAGYAQDIEELEAIITGFELDDPTCYVGSRGSTDECEIAEIEPNVWRATATDVTSDDAVTIESAFTGTADPVELAEPALPEDSGTTGRGLMGLIAALGALLAGAGAYVVSRITGRNEVGGGGAATAAYGDGPTRLVDDMELAKLATTEFAPPTGIAPWEGRALLDENVTSETTSAYLSSMAGIEALTIIEVDDDVAISDGPKWQQLDGRDAKLLNSILSIKNPYLTGTYDRRFAEAWNGIQADLQARVRARKWWSKGSLGAVKVNLGVVLGVLAALVAVVVAALFFRSTAVGAVVIVAGAGAFVGATAYSSLRPARTAAGSALYLRTLSFKKFLDASEARHVEWAWEQGLLREYSAWAVALDAADAWGSALDRANVPAESHAYLAPMLIASHSSSFSSTNTAPSSSGGGGFGGGAGGGGGGGGGGSW